jgi:hypothetical protein
VGSDPSPASPSGLIREAAQKVINEVWTNVAAKFRS